MLGGHLEWDLIGVGAVIGVAAIALDEGLGRAKLMRLPPLAVGMGIYLPMAITLLVPVGAAIGFFYERWASRALNPELAKRLGVLMATGLIVGESLFGVVFAGLVAATGAESPLALVAEHGLAVPLGLTAFAGTVALLYAATLRAAAR